MIKTIIEILKEKKVQYTLHDELFELFIGSQTCKIQVEGDNFVSFFNELGYEEGSEYNIKDVMKDSLECDISELVEVTNEDNKVYRKIRSTLEELEEYCENRGYELSEFIEINYEY